MSVKMQPDDSLMFLFRCLEASDYKTIDFHALGAATGLKAPAARMRFTRLKKKIESAASTSAISPALFGGKTEDKSRDILTTPTKERKTETENRSPVSNAGNDQIEKSELRSEVKLESPEPEIEVPPAPRKRRYRGRKADISATFYTGDSPTPGARQLRYDDSSDSEDGQDSGNGKDTLHSDLNSENERPAKRQRKAPLKRKLTRDFKQTSLSTVPSLSLSTDVPKLPSQKNATEMSVVSGVSQIHADNPSTPKRAIGIDSKPFKEHSASDEPSTLQSPTPVRNGMNSVKPRQFMHGYPTPPELRSTTIKPTYKALFDEDIANGDMHSTQHRNGNEHSNVDNMITSASSME